MRTSLSAVEARRVALAAQGFAQRPRTTEPGTRALNATVAAMAALQIDSVNVFARSHYLPLFSRLGPYDTAALDRLLFARRPRWTEYAAHEAAFVPAEDWGLFAFRMAVNRARYTTGDDGWWQRHRGVVDWVRSELTARGPLRPAQIDHDLKTARRGPWWDWDVVKSALELMWLTGEVAIAGRRGFERRYALAEDVLTPQALVPVPREDAIRELVRRAAKACGVATAADLADYFRIRDRPAVLTAIRELSDAGELAPVQVQGWADAAGRPLPAWLHREGRVPRAVDAATILTPFDPLVWFRARAERVFDFAYRIEIYTPAHKRRYGYYSLPVLIGDDVVGRVDLKADRAASTLLVQSAWWEPTHPPRAAERLAAVLRRAADWQGLEHLSVSRWGDATDDLVAALGPRTARHDAGPSRAHVAGGGVTHG